MAEPGGTIELKVGNTSTGLHMPLLGFGTCCRASSTGPALKKSTDIYLAHGGKLIDTAIMYGNHKDLGEELKAAFQKGVITRQDLWVTSKIAPDHASTEEEALQRLDESLRDLQLDYVDLFLIHAPSEHSTAVWKGLLKGKAQGKAKSIGVSNFNPAQIQALEREGLERPSVNQIEFHPWVEADVFANVAWCQSNGVAITAYGSLGSSYHKGLTNAKVQQVAQKYGKTPAQILLAWALAQGVAVVPGATSEQHILDDLGAGTVKLSSEDSDLHRFS